MVRKSKLVIGLAVVALSAAVFLAYTGNAEPVVSPAQLPGGPEHAVVAVVVVVLAGSLLSGYLGAQEWERMGREAGLSAEEALLPISKPDLTGTVGGRPVRVRTYSEGGGKNSSSKTYTVVEAELDSPVDWAASLSLASEDGGPDFDIDIEPDEGLSQLDSMDTINVDDEFMVWGEVTEDRAREILSGDVRNAITTLGSDVWIGDVEESMRAAMFDAVTDASGGMSQTIAKGMLSAAGGSEESPTTDVKHRDRGLLVDGDELERRIDAVTAVAEAVERTSAATEQ